MKKLLLLSLLLSTTFANTITCAANHPESLDQMVAIVNDDVISRSELDHALSAAEMQLTQENAAMPEKKALRKQVLDQLINKKVQLQIAKQAGVQITDSELDQTIKRIAKGNNMTVSELYERISHDGMTTEEYRSEMRDQLTLHKLQQQEVANKVNITSEEIANFTRSRTWQDNNSKEYHLQDILIPFSEVPSPAEIIAAKDRADTLVNKLHQGFSFDQLAQTESAGAEALQGGDLGWRSLSEIPTAFSEQVAHMKQDQIIGPLQTPNGFHVVRLIDTRINKEKQAKPSRKVIEAQLLQQKFEEAVQNWVSKIRSQAFIVTNI